MHADPRAAGLHLAVGGDEDSSTPAIDFRDPAWYLNRELSWLEFNRRVPTKHSTPAHRCSSG